MDESNASELQLRRVKKSDKERLWKWANEEQVRESAYDQSPIEWSEHENWFEKRLNDPSCRIYIAEKNGEPVGQIRFERNENEVVVDVSVAKASRGQGLGTELIRNGTVEYMESTDIKFVTAYVKKRNNASISAFKKAGYKKSEELEKQGCASIKLQFQSEQIS